MTDTMEEAVRYQDGIAPYVRISEMLRRHVYRQSADGNTQLPSERELARRFDVTQNTVRRAIRLLEQEQLVYSEPGRGRFIRPRPRRATGRIGVLLPGLSLLHHPVMNRRLAGIESVLNAHDYEIQINTLRDASDEKINSGAEPSSRWLKVIDSEGVDGLIILTATPNLEALNILSHRLPVAVHSPRYASSEVFTVRIDLLGGAFHSMRHLLELGHRRIALIAGPPDLVATLEFVDGCRLAVSAMANPHVSTTNHYAKGHTADEGARLAEELFASPETCKPTAILCHSYELATGIVATAQQRGIRFPQDLSLVYLAKPAGLDVMTDVTHVEYDFAAMGRHLARGMLQMIDEPGQIPPNILYEGTFHQCASSAAWRPSD